MAKEVKHLAWKLNCYKVMTTCLPQSPTTNEKFKHGSPKSPRSPRISPEGKYIFGSSPSENRRKKPSSSPSTPTTPTPPSTPRLPHTPATARKMQQLDESPKLQPVQSIMQQSTVQIQHAPPPPQQQQQQPQQRIQQQQHQPQQLIQHQMQPQTIQTKSISIKSGDGLVRYSFDLEVDYITERLIAVSFPSGGLENQYRSNLRDVVRMLKSKHNNCYVVFNLSRRRHDVSKLNQEVRDLGWPNILAPPLERLCSICKQIETWMKGNLNNVVVLHCKGGRGPIGVVVSAFMNYLSITSGNDSTMDRHAMKRFLDAKGWGSMHPSQMRYIDYFSGLLTNSIQINSSPLFLHHAVIHGVPNYDSNGGCRPFLRVYQGMSPVYTSGVYTVPEGTSRFVITPGRAIPLRGDILLKCYHKKFRSTTRDTIFRCQFHTTAVMEYRLVFQKQELDDACTDARFPEFTKVELIFSSTPDALHGSDYVSGASFPSEHIDDPLIRWDSYEHFNDIIEGPEDGGPDLNETSGNNNNNMILDIPHSSAPDGSLYAQVKKTPSPEQSPVIPRLTNGDSNAPLPYVLSPDRAPQVHTSKDGGKRNMDYRERMALDELLKGITGEDTDGGIVVNNNIQWKAPPSPDNKVLHHDPVHTRRIVSVSEDLRHAPVSQSKPKPPPPVQEDIKEEAAGQENSSPSKKPASRKESSEAENPYAEITDAMQQKLQQNPNTNQSGPQQERIQQEVVQQEMITPVLVTNKEQSAPPMMNGGISVPRSVEQHNPTYEITPKGSNHRTMQNGPVSQNGRVVQNGPMVQNGQVNLNPGQVNLNPGQINVPNGPTPMTYNQIGHNASPAQPYVAQMNGPVETPIVPNSVSRVTERTPYASRLENGPTSPVHTKYEARPVKAREDRFQLLRKGPNAPEQYQPSPPSPAQVSPVSPTNNGDDDGLGWLRRQQDKLREKREREQGRPIVRESPGEPIRVTPVNASPKLRVRFEGDVEPAPPMVSPPLSAKREEPPSWLAQQQQKLQDRQGNNITPINQAPVVATEVTPVQNAMSPAPDHLLMTGTQDGGVSLRRGVSPPPLSISKDLEQSISELGQMNTAKPAQSYVQRTVTTTTTREWEPHERPLNRQLSDLTHDRVRDPVYQRPADDQSPKVPATPSTPYDPVPPILTNSQLRNDGREEIEHWNNYGYSYNSNSMQQTGQTLPGPSASQRFFPTSPMQPKDGEKSPVGRHFHLPESRLPDNPPYNQQPARTERNVRTLNKQTLHVEATNPSQSVTLNTTHPPLSSMHGSTPSYNKDGRVFTRSVSNSGLDELLETNNNNSTTNEDPFSNLDDAVKMLSHWSNEIQKLSAPYNSSSIDANHNTHASLDNRAILSHHQLNNNNQSDDRINRTHFQTHQSSGGYHNTSQTLTNHRPQATSTPRKNFDEVDLHIDEPTEVDNIPRGVVADRSPNFVDRTPPATQSRPPRRTNSQSGYDSDTGIQQYYRPPRRRNLIDPGAEVWLQNPGGLPRKESEFWNRKDGLKSPEPPKEYDLSSSTESISGSKTPKFPVGPRAYANMTKTFIVKTGAPPHGPDQPLPLQRTMQRQDSFEIPPVPEPAARPAPTAEVHAPPRQPAPVPVTEPAREIQPTQPMFSETRVITVENRTEPSRQPMEWTPTPPAPPSQEQRYYTPTPTRPTPADDESFRQLEYLESEPWLGRKPIIHSPPHRPNAPVEVQPWIPPVVTTTMSTTGPVQTVTNGVPQTVTTTQWRREVTHQQQPIEITPITREVTEDVEARKPRNILDPPPSLLEDVVEPPTVSPVVEARFTPRYVREVNAAPPPSAPLPPATTPPQPSVVQYQEQPPRSRAMEPPITEVRLHPVELGPIQVVPVETQVIIDRKEQYPGQDARQQAAPVHSPVTSQQYQAPSSQPHQGTVTPPPTYGTVMARSPSPTFGIVKTSAPQASHGFVQNSPSSPVSYVTAPPASAPSSYSTVQPVSPPMSYGTVQSTPQRGVMTGPGQEPSIIHQRVEVREITQTESVPVSQTLQQQQPHQQPLQQHQEPPILQQTQQQVQQDIPSEQAPVSPEQPSATLNERLLNQPKPPVQYPTFSDRHRKAAKGPVDDSLPNGGAGYRTIYDNRRQRSSLGNEGQLPSPGGLSGKGVLNGSTTPPTLSGRSTPSNFYYTQKLSPYGSSSSLADPSVEHVRFVKDLSAWWYKPNISRDDAINILKDKPPGTFIVRDSNSFPGAFGLALKVAQVPANTTPRKGGDPQSELVRHFLIEPNARGVRLKGCVNEPIFSSLSALIYQHTLTQLALPIKLVLPDMGGRYSSASNDYPSGADATDAGLDPKSAASLLQQGAACKVLYIDSVDMESLTGTEAIREGLTKTLTAKKKPEAVVVHFKVSSKGITLTDTQRKLFFRKHYPVKSILFCGMDPLTRKYPRKEGQEVADAKIFGFVARKPGSLTDNQCHLFADWEVEQPASAIVSFVTKVMLGSASKSSVKTP
ncbi:tensin-1-like isoform X4 [Lytechinus variegatus]|uniref:tensin-1-like isoform X4 n=1 Tax=Lytechinus variegatus TaxID=7654 RepID=UPI001BB1C2E1|nr:tensin-1-like isoform X4 [Lytechinus variegatus]